MKLSTKISLLVITVALGIGMLSDILASRIMINAMTSELEKKSVAISRSLADHITHNVLSGEVVQTFESLKNIKRITEGQKYVFVVGFDGNVFAHTFDGHFPAALLKAEAEHELVHTDKPVFTRYMTREGPLLDIAYPLIEGLTAHIHIGMDEGQIIHQVRKLRYKIMVPALLIVLFGIVVAFIISQRITSPLKRLAGSMRVFGEGKIKEPLAVQSAGFEIEELTSSFNLMIEQRKHAEEKLLKSRDELQTLFNSSTDAIFLLDLEGNFIDINKTAYERLGYTKREMLAMHISRLYPPKFAAQVPEQIEQLKKYGKVIFESAHVRKDTTIMPVEVNAKMLNYGGKMVILSVIRDISERKQSENALKNAKEKLENQYEELKMLDKMKDGLLSDVTHELKTPVAKQLMQIDLMKRFLAEYNLLEKSKKIINTMESSIQRQEHVIQNILNLSRLESGGRQYQYKPFRIDILLEEVLDDYQTTLTAYKIEIKTELQEVEINSDKEMLFVVFSNLVNNSIKYRRNHKPAKIGVYLEKNKKIITVKIIDNGIGITETEHQQVFERFYQASASAEGSGIGLSISKLIVNDLGGRIWLESSGKNKGTTAVAELPVLPEN